MASIQTIAKARAIAAGIGKATGIEPDLDIRDDHVRLYYSENKKESAAKEWAAFINSTDTGDVRVDFQAELMPGIFQKYWMYALAGTVLVYAISK